MGPSLDATGYLPSEIVRRTNDAGQCAIGMVRLLLWDTFVSLNRITAPQLCRLVTDTGFKIVRDYRTQDEIPIPPDLAEIYNEAILTTQQIVLLLRHA